MKPFEQWTEAEKRLYWDNLKNRINSKQGFSANIGVTLTEVHLDYAEGYIDIQPNYGSLQNIIHGGCLSTLAESVAFGAAATRAKAIITLNFEYNYLRTASGHRIFCSASSLKVGRKIAVFYTTVKDEKNVYLANGRFTYLIKEWHYNELLPESVRTLPEENP